MKFSWLTLGKLTLITLLPPLLIFLPFALRLPYFLWINLQDSGMQQIYANWDGPNYVLNAITLYDPVKISERLFMSQSLEYFPAHFPLFSWLIKLVAPLTGYFAGGLLVNLAASLALNILFFTAVKHHTKYPLFLTFAFTVFPARYLVVRSVISPETLLVFFMLAAVLLWGRKSYILAGVMGMLAVMTKFQAVFLVAGIALFELYFAWTNKKLSSLFSAKKIFGIQLIPTGYLIVALYYQSVTGNFDSYFRAQDGVGMGARLPLSMFQYDGRWVGTGWLEDIVLYFAIASIAVVSMWQEARHRLYACVVGVYALLMTLIPQHDIMRLIMPIFPFVYIHFAHVLEQKAFRYGLIIILPVIYMFAVNFVMTNRAPISDWSLFR